jgi:hypothetical protein
VAAAQSAPVYLPAVSVKEAAGQMRSALAVTLPAEFDFRCENNWGHQAQIPSIQGVRFIQVMRNHGDWERARVVVRETPKRVNLRIGDLMSPEENRVAFTVYVNLPAVVELEKQTWQNGIQVYGGHVRARFQLSAAIRMEATLTGKDVRNMQVVRATFTAGDFLVENINGLGGDLGRLVGAGAERRFKPWQPLILAQFQTAVLDSLASASENAAVRGAMSQLLMNSMVARSANLNGLEMALRGPEPVAEAFPLPIPVVFGGATMEFPILIRFDRAPARPAAPESRAREREQEHWNLCDHSIHYAPAAHATGHSSSPPHAGTVHKK